MAGPLAAARKFLHIAYLFNKYDLISTVGPVMAVGVVLVGVPNIGAFLSGFIWEELHLFAFEIENQITGLEEDRLSKPERPLVTGMLSLRTAQRIYFALIIASLIQSYYYGILIPSVIHLVAMVAYNEFEFAKFWALKNFIGAMGYVCYCWGVTVIFDHGRPLSPNATLAVILSGLIFTTTGHAQDFRDRAGDAAVGRVTLAHILPPATARWSLMALMFAWSAGLVYIWGPPLTASLAFFGLAVHTTVGFVRDYSEQADRVSYWWYNVWLIAAHMLPLFKRLADQRVQFLGLF